METLSLQLKPHVIINQENTEPDLPKEEDQAIRPYVNPQSNIVIEESHRPESVDDTSVFISEVNHDISDSNRRNRTLGEENIEDNEKSTNSAYQIVTLRNNSLSFKIILVDDMTFYQKTECCAWVNEHNIEKTSSKAEVEKTWKADIQKTVDAISNTLGKFRVQSAAKNPNHKDSVASPKHHPLQRLLVTAELQNTLSKHSLQRLFATAELQTTWSKNSSEVHGKQDRKRKFHEWLGAFDDVHFVNPAPLVVVFPVSRQNVTLGQRSSEEAPQGTLGPSQRPQRQWPPDSIYGRPWADFRQELCRVSTFASLSPNFPVFAVRLARTGFICLPDGAIVCYFCGVQRDKWSWGDSPEVVHRQLNASCSILTGVNCNNVPVTIIDAHQLRALLEVWSLSGPSLFGSREDPSRQTGATERVASSLAPLAMTPESVVPRPQVGAQLNENETVDSLHQPPTSLSQASAPTAATATATGPQQLGTASRNQTNQNMAVNNNQAVSGQADVDSNTQTSDEQPSATGSSTSPEGTASNAGPSPSESATVRRIYDGTAQPEPPGSVRQSPPSPSETPGQKVVTYQELGIMTEAPKRPDMATVEARVVTFRTWPSTHAQTPLLMAEAGFYYAGYADCGRCFQCGGGLKNWEPVDNPWVEHARWFKKCDYIKQCKGQDFIDVVGELNSRGNGEFTMDQVREELNNQRVSGTHVDEPAVDPAISAVLHIGYGQEAVDAAVRRLQADGNLLTVDRLMAYLEEDGALAAGSVENSAEPIDPSEMEDLVTQNNEIRQQRLCKICLDREVCIVFLPCGHLVCCTECSPPLRNCPMCRQGIKGRARAFPF